MKKRNLALAMVLAMAMTTMGSATVFADDASDDAAGNLTQSHMYRPQ